MKATYFALVFALVACAWAVGEQFLPRICTLRMDPGTTCSNQKPSIRYTFDLSVRKCVPLNYNGCKGTANNFDTKLECQKTCTEDDSTPAPPPTAEPPTPPTMPPVCNHEISLGQFCPNVQPSNRYGYSLEKRQCATFTYNGCEGNENNFDTMAKCRTTCEKNY